ncbi:hypothetical protein LCGC14_2982120, partial [marine sediment metagenome]
VMEIPQEAGDAPPRWVVYFTSADTDAAVAKAKSLGGQVAAHPQDTPEVGRMAALVDPQGAHFSVIKLANPPQ